MEVKEAIQQISEEQLRIWVKELAFPRHYTAEPEANKKAGEWLQKAFSEMDYRVERQGPFSNILAFPRHDIKEAILVAAHYDSVPGSFGADDNASAVAAMLGCAAVCRQSTARVPVIFAGFNCEEDGFIGSNDFVANYLPGSDIKIRAAHILEMLGCATTEPRSQRLPTGLPIQLRDTGDFLGLLANDASASIMEDVLRAGRAVVPELAASGLQVVAGAERIIPVLARSDHVPFWRNGIPALMWTDTAEFRNNHYHRETDTPETLNYAFLRSVTQMLAAALLA
jgi:Zn-dependent M28 family amino/carboxypeptidase